MCTCSGWAWGSILASLASWHCPWRLASRGEGQGAASPQGSCPVGGPPGPLTRWSAVWQHWPPQRPGWLPVSPRAFKRSFPDPGAPGQYKVGPLNLLWAPITHCSSSTEKLKGVQCAFSRWFWFWWIAFKKEKALFSQIFANKLMNSEFAVGSLIKLMTFWCLESKFPTSLEIRFQGHRFSGENFQTDDVCMNRSQSTKCLNDTRLLFLWILSALCNPQK